MMPLKFYTSKITFVKKTISLRVDKCGAEGAGGAGGAEGAEGAGGAGGAERQERQERQERTYNFWIQSSRNPTQNFVHLVWGNALVTS
ncbi:MAG: hypothetical protein F6K31_14000 [Symploca sp. SIO2G7]|nr:hypothetical protein [Symploca sp. SIO2G7]